MDKISDNILSWCPNLEFEAKQQAINLSEHPCLVGNVCLMPDAHAGYGMPIGGVVALKNAVCPNMVGVDIGCGMHFAKTSIKDLSRQQLLDVAEIIKATVPVGMKHQEKAQEHSFLFNSPVWQDENMVCHHELESARHQLGTLGGGNHFIEIQKDISGSICFMIHCGSRNLGYKVAKNYNVIAEDRCSDFRQDKVVKDGLAFLPTGAPEFAAYWTEMNLCLIFAEENRKRIASKVLDALIAVRPDVEVIDFLDVHHNYAALEHHYSQNVYVHRKGAILARNGMLGIIPGSQGASSYIVRGLGNPASLCSCSHGAGRVLSRRAARETLSLEKEQEYMNKKGIIHFMKSKDDLEEATSAYKSITEVIANQRDLIEPINELNALLVIKG